MNMKRMRGRNHRSGGGGAIRHNNGQVPLNRNHVFDSNGPDMRLRGTAQQLFEKYLQLGRDASSSDDRVAAEGYFQHAEHYFRIVNAMAQAAQQNQGQHGQGQQGQGGYNQNQQGQRRFVDLDEGDDEGESQPRSQGGGNQGGHQGGNGHRDGQQQRDFPNRDNREFSNRDRGASQREGQRDGQREFQPRDQGRDTYRDQRFRQPVAQAATQSADHVTQSAEDRDFAQPVVRAAESGRDAPRREPRRPEGTFDAPAAVEQVAPRAAEPPVESPVESHPQADAEPPAPPARAPRAPRARRRPAAAQSAEVQGTGDQPEITPVPSLSTVED